MTDAWSTASQHHYENLLLRLSLKGICNGHDRCSLENGVEKLFVYEAQRLGVYFKDANTPIPISINIILDPDSSLIFLDLEPVKEAQYCTSSLPLDVQKKLLKTSPLLTTGIKITRRDKKEGVEVNVELDGNIIRDIGMRVAYPCEDRSHSTYD
jgi:hypothetical protein